MPLSADKLDVAEQTFLDEIIRVVIQHAVMTLMTDGQQKALFFGLANHLLALSNIVSHQLFCQHVQTRVKTGDRDRSVLAEWYSDHDHLEFNFALCASFEQFQMIFVDLDF